ncbi:MAG: ATP-binding protein [Patescibacteria group bacterium]
MIRINKHIEIVRSSTSKLSSMSKESCSAIYNVLTKHYSNVGISTVNNLEDLERLVNCRPDLVFLGMKFIYIDLGLPLPSKIWISKYLDDENIVYTGSNKSAHRLEYNKHLAKQQMLNSGIKTSPFYIIKRNETQKKYNRFLKFPLFVKPTNLRGGMGINSQSVVHNFKDLYLKVNSISNTLNSDVLVEEYLPGREFSVAILKDKYSKRLGVMPIELTTTPDKNGVKLLSRKIKSSNSECITEVTDQVIKSEIIKLSINAFNALGARDYGRIDIRLDKKGVPHFLEANLIPSLIDNYGSFPKACMLNINLGYEEMIMGIVKLAFIRDLEMKNTITQIFNRSNNLIAE